MNDDVVWTIRRYPFHQQLQDRGVAPETLSEEEVKDLFWAFAFDDEVNDLLWMVIDRALSQVLARRHPKYERERFNGAVVWAPTRLAAFSAAFDNLGVDESALTKEHVQLLRDAGESPEVAWPLFEATIAAVRDVIDGIPRLATPRNEGRPPKRSDRAGKANTPADS